MPPSCGQRTGNLDKECAATVYNGCMRLWIDRKKNSNMQVHVGLIVTLVESQKDRQIDGDKVLNHVSTLIVHMYVST